MTPCPSPIYICPNIQIDNRFFLGLSYKMWMFAKDIFIKKHIINVSQFFEERKYIRTLTWDERKESPPSKVTPTERPRQTNYPSNNYGSRRNRSRYRYCKDLYTYKTPEPEIIITTYQTSQLKEKVYLFPLILFKQLVDELDNLKRRQQKSISFDKYRKHKEWSTKIYKNPFKKKKKYNWMEMGRKQAEHWTKLSQEKTTLMIIEKTPRTIYYLEYDYHSPQSEQLFKEISEVTYDPLYSNCKIEGARKIVLDDYPNHKGYKDEDTKKEYFKDW
jgi:hypothetical protein